MVTVLAAIAASMAAERERGITGKRAPRRPRLSRHPSKRWAARTRSWFAAANTRAKGQRKMPDRRARPRLRSVFPSLPLDCFFGFEADRVDLVLVHFPLRRVLLQAEGAFAIRGDQRRAVRNVLADVGEDRSEEHTSELQSQSNLVCRLLLEK